MIAVARQQVIAIVLAKAPEFAIRCAGREPHLDKRHVANLHSRRDITPIVIEGKRVQVMQKARQIFIQQDRGHRFAPRFLSPRAAAASKLAFGPLSCHRLAVLEG